MPTCVLARSPQAFAIPVDGHDLKDLKKYLQPLQLLGSIAAELTKLHTEPAARFKPSPS